MPVLRRIAASLALLVLAVGCGAPSAPPAAPAATPSPLPSAQPAPAGTAPPADSPAGSVPSAEPGSAAASWVMPDLVGATLQDAQDAIQALTDFGIPITTSIDATGEDRNQINDRNWTVCSQNVAPGETITGGTAIDFAVVQLDESCR